MRRRSFSRRQGEPLSWSRQHFAIAATAADNERDVRAYSIFQPSLMSLVGQDRELTVRRVVIQFESTYTVTSGAGGVGYGVIARNGLYVGSPAAPAADPIMSFATPEDSAVDWLHLWSDCAQRPGSFPGHSFSFGCTARGQECKDLDVRVARRINTEQALIWSITLEVMPTLGTIDETANWDTQAIVSILWQRSMRKR